MASPQQQQQFYDYDLFDGELWDDLKFDADVYDAAVLQPQHTL